MRSAIQVTSGKAPAGRWLGSGGKVMNREPPWLRTVMSDVRSWSFWNQYLCRAFVTAQWVSQKGGLSWSQSYVLALKLLQRRSEGQWLSWFVRTMGRSSRIIEADLLLKPVVISSITCRLGLLKVSQRIPLIARSFSGSRFRSNKFLKLFKKWKVGWQVCMEEK